MLFPHIHQSTSLPYPELCFPTADVSCAATGAALLDAICRNNPQERALEGSAPPGDTAAKCCPDSAKPQCCHAKKQQLNMQQHTRMMLKRLWAYLSFSREITLTPFAALPLPISFSNPRKKGCFNAFTVFITILIKRKPRTFIHPHTVYARMRNKRTHLPSWHHLLTYIQ